MSYCSGLPDIIKLRSSKLVCVQYSFILKTDLKSVSHIVRERSKLVSLAPQTLILMPRTPRVPMNPWGCIKEVCVHMCAHVWAPRVWEGGSLALVRFSKGVHGSKGDYKPWPVGKVSQECQLEGFLSAAGGLWNHAASPFPAHTTSPHSSPPRCGWDLSLEPFAPLSHENKCAQNSQVTEKSCEEWPPPPRTIE